MEKARKIINGISWGIVVITGILLLLIGEPYHHWLLRISEREFPMETRISYL